MGDPTTTLRMGAVTLSVADLARSITYYEEAIGMTLRHREDGRAELGTTQDVLLRLLEKRGARVSPRSPGLFHFAVLVPTRGDLGRALAHFVERRVPLQGVADHLVSEALYLNDPDGHGIEIYRDRPRTEWEREDGGLRMATLPLDVEGLRESAGGGPTPHELPPGTGMGHVHLRVSALEPAAEFFERTIGMATEATMPGAVFLGADGYHHHVGANVWQSRGQPPRPRESLGLERFEVVMPDEQSHAAVMTRADDDGYAMDDNQNAVTVVGVDDIPCEFTIG